MVKAGFVDGDNLLSTAKGVHLNRPPFICIQTCRSITVFGNAEDVAHILEDKPRFAAHLYGADFVGLVVENLNVAHFTFSFLLKAMPSA